MSIHHKTQQGSAEWYKMRLGIPTASNFHKLVTPGGALAQSQKSRAYKYRLIAERILVESMDDELGGVRWVDQGKEYEPFAAAHFAAINDVELEDGGFWTSDDGRIGASPDRLIGGRNIGLEIKCVAPFTQVGYHLDGLADDYRPQVQGQLLVAGFSSAIFFSWHRQLPSWTKVTPPDKPYMTLLKNVLDQFCDELDRDTERAKKLGLFVVATEPRTPADAAYSEEEPFTLRSPE